MINLVTKRLLIRNARTHDTSYLYWIRESLFVQRFNAMRPLSYDEYAKEIDASLTDDQQLVIEQKDRMRPIGVIHWGPDHLRYASNSIVISYWIGQEYARQGFMSEALKAVIDYLFSRPDVDVIVARVFNENVPSLRLVEKLGFVREGMLRHAVKGYGGKIFDDALFSILKSDWKPAK